MLSDTPSPKVRQEIVYLETGQVDIYHVNELDYNNHPHHVFLHGWGLSPKSYLPAISKLAEKSGYIVAPSLPGFGKSTALSDPFRDNHVRTADIIANSLKETLHPDTLPLPFIGHSLGGGLSITIAERHPELVSGLHLITPIGGSSVNAVSWAKVFSSLRHEIGINSVQRIMDVLPSFLGNPIPLAVSGVTARHTDLVNILVDLDKKGLPVQLILADNDEVVPAKKYRAIPELNIIEVEGTHGWVLTHPEDCADIIFTTNSMR